MKNRILTVVLLMGTLGAFAQQIEQLSNYAMNDYILNPAIAGSRDYFDVKAMNRHQWTGVQDAPRTFSLALNGPLKNKKVGMGGYLFTDNVGPTRRTGAQLSYSYHFKLNDHFKLGLGLSAGVLQFSIDGTKINMAQDGDPALYSELRSKTVFDAKFGAYLYEENFYFGFTMPQIFQNEVSLYDSDSPEQNRLEDHYIVYTGYKIPINDDVTVEPSVLFKYVNPSPLKYDVSLRVHYRDLMWVGATYRNNDAWVTMVGFDVKERISLGYAYDFSTNAIGNIGSGTHEFVVGFRFKQ